MIFLISAADSPSHIRQEEQSLYSFLQIKQSGGEEYILLVFDEDLQMFTIPKIKKNEYEGFVSKICNFLDRERYLTSFPPLKRVDGINVAMIDSKLFDGLFHTMFSLYEQRGSIPNFIFISKELFLKTFRERKEEGPVTLKWSGRDIVVDGDISAESIKTFEEMYPPNAWTPLAYKSVSLEERAEMIEIKKIIAQYSEREFPDPKRDSQDIYTEEYSLAALLLKEAPKDPPKYVGPNPPTRISLLDQENYSYDLNPDVRGTVLCMVFSKERAKAILDIMANGTSAYLPNYH